jgi:uncharacterized Zn-binding protein involved in type VI secretion
MPRVVKIGDPSRGHCWPPTVPNPAVAGRANVLANNLQIVAVGDSYFPHPGPCGKVPPHPVAVAAGSPTVFIGGRAVLRDGDPLACGDTAKSITGNVYIN